MRYLIRTIRTLATFRAVAVDSPMSLAYVARRPFKEPVMKVVNSLKSAKSRHRDNRVIRRKGRIYVINKRHPRFKARQG